MAEAIGGDFIQQLRQLLAEPGKPVLRVERTRAIGLALVFVGVDQIDIGTEIQLAAAEFPQPEWSGASKPCSARWSLGRVPSTPTS